MKPLLFLLLALPALADPSWVEEFRATAHKGISCEPAAVLASQIATRHGVPGKIVYVWPSGAKEGHVAFYDASSPWPWCVSNDRVAQVQISCRGCPPDCDSSDHWSPGQAWTLVADGPGRGDRWGRCTFSKLVRVVRTGP